MLGQKGSGLFRVAYPEAHLLALAEDVRKLTGVCRIPSHRVPMGPILRWSCMLTSL